MGQLSPEELETLAEKWLNGSILPEEERSFDQWYEQVNDPMITIDSEDGSAEAFKARLLDRITTSMAEEGIIITRNAPAMVEAGTAPAKLVTMAPDTHWQTRRLRLSIAAASVLILAWGIWLSTGSRKTGASGLAKTPIHAGTPVSTELLPGTNGAVLTLADGRNLTLDSTVDGKIATQGNSTVFNTRAQLSYTTGSPTVSTSSASETTRSSTESKGGPIVSKGSPAGTLYNTLSTDRGRQYRLTLPDGTGVWLNAASSITYPTAFNGHERTVSITGEAYFEVVHNEKMPFTVKVAGQVIEDLGTHFNINAYQDEPRLKTTVLEGSVKIGNRVLLPGEQAGINAKGQMQVLKGVDIGQAVAWKNGLFQFDHADLKSVMGQLSRWYNVDVRYEGNIAPRQFGGKISRFSNGADVLKILELSQVHFKIQDRTIIVMP